MVFPRFSSGIFWLSRSDRGFVVETDLQVSERVLGFTERRGSTTESHQYEPGSGYYQRPITRFFTTTGVCWYFVDAPAVMTEVAAAFICEAFCMMFGIQERDISVGGFHSQTSPLRMEVCQGMCVYDATNGSLRLTQKLAENFPKVVALAVKVAQARGEAAVQTSLEKLCELAMQMQLVKVQPEGEVPVPEGDWITVIAPRQKAMFKSDRGDREVTVLRWRYTPHGLMYDLEHPSGPETRWTVPANLIQPIYGQTEMIRVNLITGESKSVSV